MQKHLHLVRPQYNSSINFFKTMLLLLVLIGSCISVTTAQITITQDQVQSIFTAGKDLYFSQSDGSAPTINVGKTGGPNVYTLSDNGFPQPTIKHTFDISTIGNLVSRFPANSITMGSNPDSINENIFTFSNNALTTPGAIAMQAPYQIRHKEPAEIICSFPLQYVSGNYQEYSQSDSMFTQTWGYLSSSSVSKTKTSTVDGFGTLNIGPFSFECLRMKITDNDGNKQFIFFTREGLLMEIEAASSQPDTGVIQIQGGVAFLENHLMAVGDEKNIQPKEFSLSQNYPNPFNPSTRISFSLKKSGHATLSVYNVLGEKVATLVNGNLTAGAHEYSFDASRLSSGIYFYSLESNGSSLVRKMSLVK